MLCTVLSIALEQSVIILPNNIGALYIKHCAMLQATLMTLRQACQALYSELAVLAKQLLLLAPPLPMLTRKCNATLHPTSCASRSTRTRSTMLHTSLTDTNVQAVISAGQKHGLFSIHASPANCGTLASVAYIGLVSSLAICAHDRQQLSRRESRQNNNAADTWGLRYAVHCL